MGGGRGTRGWGEGGRGKERRGRGTLRWRGYFEPENTSSAPRSTRAKCSVVPSGCNKQKVCLKTPDDDNYNGGDEAQDG